MTLMLTSAAIGAALLATAPAGAALAQSGGADGCRSMPQEAIVGGKRRQPTEGEVEQRLAQACGGAEAGEARSRVPTPPDTGAAESGGEAERP